MNANGTHSAMFSNIVMACFVAAVALTMVEFTPLAGGQALSSHAASVQNASATGSTSVPDAGTALSGAADDSAAPAPTF